MSDDLPAYIEDYDSKTVKLNNDIEMPILGYGVYQIPEAETERCVLDAFSVGYRSIDTAQIYKNEAGVGNAIKNSGIPREQIFVTTKVWVSNYENCKESVIESMKKLQVDYLDLILLHQAMGNYYKAWHDLEDLYNEGKLKAIGVSNFYPDRLADLCCHCRIKPMVNQVEEHVYYQKEIDRKWNEKLGVQMEAWAPLSETRVQELLVNPTIVKIAKAHNKTPAQVALRFSIQRKIVIIPKTVNKNRMAENFNIFDFKLTHEEMEEIQKLDEGKSQLIDPLDPKIVMFVASL